MSNLTRSTTSSRSRFWPSREGSWRTGAEHGEKERISTMTLEVVLDRAVRCIEPSGGRYGPRVERTNLIRFREPRRAEPSGRGIARDAGPPLVPTECCGTRRVCLIGGDCDTSHYHSLRRRSIPPMTTPQKIAANQRNALLRSTGPRTPGCLTTSRATPSALFNRVSVWSF